MALVNQRELTSTIDPPPQCLLFAGGVPARAAAGAARHDVDEARGPLDWVALVFLVVLVLGAVRGAIRMQRGTRSAPRGRRRPHVTRPRPHVRRRSYTGDLE